MVISLMAILAGAAGPSAIARWATFKAEQLSMVLPLPYGIPQKDVYRRVFCTLKADAFQVCFVSWLQSLRAEAAATGVQQPILAVDSKTPRRSHDRKKDLGALHSVTVWASDFGLTLAQVATARRRTNSPRFPRF